MTAPTDAALRERVQRTLVAKLAHAYGMDILDAVLAAIPEPPVRRVELDVGWSATWKDDMYTVYGPDGTARCCWSTAVSIASQYIGDVSKSDAKVLELLALKGDVKDTTDPFAGGDYNVMQAKAWFAVCALLDRVVKGWQKPGRSAQSSALDAIAELAATPPTAPAPTREVIGHAVMRTSGSVVKAWWNNGKTENNIYHLSEAFRRAELKGNEDCATYTILRGDKVEAT